jgi:methionyl-tRNA formyltransferase
MTQLLKGIGVIAAPTFRSRAYLQMLAARGMQPEIVLHLPAEEDVWDGPAMLELQITPHSEVFEFHPGETARKTVEAQGWSSIDLTSVDVNSNSGVVAISGLSTKVLIYSGMPKALLREPLLKTGIRFLHIHGGYVPAYRGATGFYFGLLERGKLGVSAIWLDEGIDTGPIIARDWYRPIFGVDIDLIMDPVVRADLLVNLLSHYLAHKQFPSTEQSGASENFFVIHPVLKHLALRRAGLMIEDDNTTGI